MLNTIHSSVAAQAIEHLVCSMPDFFESLEAYKCCYDAEIHCSDMLVTIILNNCILKKVRSRNLADQVPPSSDGQRGPGLDPPASLLLPVHPRDGPQAVRRDGDPVATTKRTEQ